jgi:hypothetical protein
MASGAPLTALFLLLVVASSFLRLLTRVFLLANTSGLFFASALTALFLFARLLPMLFFGLSQLLIRAGLPQRLSRLVPTPGHKSPPWGNVVTTYPAFAGDASTLDRQKGATDPGNQRDDAEADPQRRKRRRCVAAGLAGLVEGALSAGAGTAASDSAGLGAWRFRMAAS